MPKPDRFLISLVTDRRPMCQQLGNLWAKLIVMPFTDLGKITRDFIILNDILRLNETRERPLGIKLFDLSAMPSRLSSDSLSK